MQRILFLENEMREDARGHTVKRILVRRGHLDPGQERTHLNPGQERIHLNPGQERITTYQERAHLNPGQERITTYQERAHLNPVSTWERNTSIPT